MKYETPLLETKRLILKRGTYEDYIKVYEYDFSRLRGVSKEFEFVKNNPDNIRGYETYADEEDNVLDFIVYLKPDNCPIGHITFDHYDAKLKSLEIGVNLHPDYWKNGYMTEALVKAMQYVFNNLDIDSLFYAYAEENDRSKKLCERLGFEYYSDYLEYYIRLGKDVREIKTILTRDKFNEK